MSRAKKKSLALRNPASCERREGKAELWKKITFSLILAIFCAAFFHGTPPVRGTNQSIFTISVWVKPSGSAASKAILGKAEELRIATNGSGQPVCQIKSSSAWQTAATSSASISVGQWSHVSCTYDLAYVRIYVNGVEKGSQALAVAADDTSAVWKIGRDESASTPYGYFAGQVDEYKIYNSALTPDQIAIDMNQGKVMQLGGQTSATGATGAAAEYCVPGDSTSCAGPVGEWKFDEKTGGTANDTSGNGNVGTWNGTGTHWTRGQFGSAGSFNGSDDYVQVANSVSNVNTIQAWVKIPPGYEGTFIFSDYLAGRSQGEFRTGGSGTITYQIYDNPNCTQIIADSNGSVADNQWHFILGERSGGTLKLYVDGQLQTDQPADTCPASITSGANYHFATSSAFSNFLNMSVDQVRIFNYARTPAQIAWDYNRGKPVGWWKMDEGEGDKAYDFSGNSNTGTLTQMDPPNDWVTGKFGKALDFDGSDDRISVDHSSSLAITGDMTIAAWIKVTNFSSARGIVGKSLSYKPAPYDYYLYQSSGIPGFYRGNGTSVDKVDGNSAPSTGIWQHVAVTMKGTAVNHYLNGKDNGSGTLSTAIADSGGTCIIGSRDDLWTKMFGQLDDVRVYNYALTAEQVRQVMNEGSAVRFGE